MGKSEKEILTNLQERADQFEMPVEDFVWDAIERENFPKEKKRRSLFWWKLGASVFLIGLITSILTSQYGIQDTTETTGEKTVVYKPIEQRSATNEASPPITQALTLANPVTADAPLKSQVSVDQKKSIVNSKDDNNNNNNENALDFSKANKPSSLKTDSDSPKSILDSNSGRVAAESIELSSKTDSDFENSAVDTFESNISESNLPRADIQKSSSSKGETETVSEKDSKNKVTNSTLPEEAILVDNDTKKDTRFAILIRGGFGESFRILSSNMHQDLIAHKNDHESFGGCFAGGIDFQFPLSERFILRTGLGYKFYSDKYDFQHDIITHRTRNDYQYMQIPLIVGYSVLNRPKSELLILAGGNANLLSSAQSSWVDPNLLVPVAHSSDSNNTPFRSFTGAITLGLDYNVQLSKNFRLHFIPSVDTFFNSIYKRETDLNELPYSFNMDVGISYNF